MDQRSKQREKNQRLRIKNKLKVEWKESGAKDRLNMTSGGFIQFKMVPMCVNAYILGCGSSLLKVLMVNFNFWSETTCTLKVFPRISHFPDKKRKVWWENCTDEKNTWKLFAPRQLLKTKRDAWLSFFLTKNSTKIWKQIFRSDFTRKYNWYETLFLLLRFHNSFCEMVAPPFLEMTKDYLAEQNNFLNSPFPKQLVWKPHHIGIKMITLSAGLWLLFLCFLKLNKGFCWFRHWVLACLQP